MRQLTLIMTEDTGEMRYSVERRLDVDLTGLASVNFTVSDMMRDLDRQVASPEYREVHAGPAPVVTPWNQPVPPLWNGEPLLWTGPQAPPRPATREAEPFTF